LFLLATNDKTVKLWRVHEKKIKRPQRPAKPASDSSSDIVIPKLGHYQTLTQATPKRVYSNAHGYHINSISLNSDGETFVSADDLRINLWNLEICNESFNIVDVKPANLEELTEVITSASFHPSSCNQLIYSSSRGSIRLADLREQSLCDHHAKLFEIEEDPANKSFFSEIISSISDARFTPDGRYLLSRDYLTLKMWDVNMENKPVLTIPIHEYLKMHLCDLYENDCIFDKFECSSSQDGTRFLTGSYNNNFVLYHTLSNTSLTIEALKDPPKKKPNKAAKLNKKPKKEKKPEAPNVNLMDFGKKALHVAYHPSAPCIAVAGLNKLYIYQA
jgi:serine/threonine-protein phosphatase 2A regulatory subunit B